jgi:peptide/nickel transport system substrate-binding protein
MRSRIAVGLLLCAFGAGIGACGSGDDSARSQSNPEVTTLPPAAGKLVNDGTFHYVIGSDPGSLDYALNSGVQVQQLSAFAYDNLVASIDGRKIVPNLATKWTVTPKSATFTIRDGVTCSDGSPVTPSVIEKGFAFYKEPTVQSPIFGDVSDWTVHGDDAAKTVTFTFGQPVSFPLQSLANVPVVCGKGLADRKLLRTHTSGSGPYVLTKAASNDEYVLERRDGYTWGPNGATTAEPGLPKTVELRVVEDPTTAVNLLLNSELNGAAIPESQLQRLGADPRVLRTPSIVGQAWFNHLKGRPTADPAVRRALAMALDRESLATVARGHVASNLVAPFTNPCPDPANIKAIPPFDAAAAEKLLDEAGWTKGSDGTRSKNGKPLELKALIVSGGSIPAEWASAAELAIKSWRALGIDVTTHTLSSTAFIETVVSGDWDVLPASQIGVDTPDQLTGFFSGSPPPNGSNLMRIKNPTYDRYTKQALDADTPQASCPAWNAAERALYEQADIIPLFFGDDLWAMDKSTDYRVTAFGVVPTTVRLHAG